MICFTVLQLVLQAPYVMSKIQGDLGDAFGSVHGYALNLLEKRRLMSEIDISVVLRAWGLYGEIVRVNHAGEHDMTAVGNIPDDDPKDRRKPDVVIYCTGAHYFPVGKFEKTNDTQMQKHLTV